MGQDLLAACLRQPLDVLDSHVLAGLWLAGDGGCLGALAPVAAERLRPAWQSLEKLPAAAAAELAWESLWIDACQPKKGLLAEDLSPESYRREALALENELSGFMSAFWRRPCRVVYQGQSRESAAPDYQVAISADLAWCCGALSGTELAALCRRIGHLRAAGEAAPLLDRREGVAQRHRFRAYVPAPSHCCFDFWCEGSAADAAATGCSGEDAFGLRLGVELFLCRSSSWPGEMVRGWESLDLPRCQLLIGAWGWSWPGRCYRQNGLLFFAVEGEMTMERDLPIELSLGVIELPLKTVLELRPGAELAFKHPGTFKAMLKIGDAQWAAADVSFSDEQVRLRVSAILALRESGGPRSLDQLVPIV